MAVLAFAEGSIQLLPDGTLLIHIAMILAMIWILNRTFFRPINKVIESRDARRGGGVTEAETILKQVDEKHALLEAEMLGARTRGYELIEQVRGEAVAQRDAAIASARAEVEEKTAKDRVELEAQTVAARAEIATAAEKMADQISSNIMKAA
jgi:F-type H+-transporting ATPase subunit b